MPKVVTKTRAKGDTPSVVRPKAKATPAIPKARSAPQPVSTEDHARPPRKAKTDANAKWEELVPGRKRAHSDTVTKPPPTKRVKSANVQGGGMVGNNAKHSKAAKTAPAVKPPATQRSTPKDAPRRQATSSASKPSTGVAKRALVPRHNNDSDETSDYNHDPEQFSAAIMGFDPSESPSEFEGTQDEAEDDEEEDVDEDEGVDEDEDEDDEGMDVKGEDEEDDDDVGPQEVPAWTADLRDDTPLPDFFTDAPRLSAHKTSKTPARLDRISRLSPDASDEEPIIRVKNLAEGLFDNDLDVVKTKKAKPRKTTAAQLLKKAKEEPVFYNSEADVDGDESEPEDEAGTGADEDLGDDNDDMWPEWTTVKTNSAGVPNLTLQHPLVRRAVNQAIKFIEHDFAFVTGYPEILGKTQYVDENIVAGAQCAQVPPILVKRFIKDVEFRRALTLHTRNRLSHARKDLKNIVAGLIVPLLNLSPRGTLLPAPVIHSAHHGYTHGCHDPDPYPYPPKTRTRVTGTGISAYGRLF
ncbi:hypothetical protein EUX98_g9706 [Antrodiella citrinella]|uniref:Uncharacterized protein n=1 Tax=Antrodiella citrinella TaxID=2447956 RepID=A0A4S4LMW9_9APHY|nr:hypothetical protein EUX98_g9706 [Antrodiella citrinella]